MHVFGHVFKEHEEEGCATVEYYFTMKSYIIFFTVKLVNYPDQGELDLIRKNTRSGCVFYFVMK